MNAGTCWGKNTIGPSVRSVERPRDVTLPFLHQISYREKEISMKMIQKILKEIKPIPLVVRIKMC
jgi:hypothetical protein